MGPPEHQGHTNYFGISCPSATLLEGFVSFTILSCHSVEQFPLLSCMMTWVVFVWVFFVLYESYQ